MKDLTDLTEIRSKVKRSGHLLYSAAYTSQTQEQQHFTISEVAADWHELMIPVRHNLSVIMPNTVDDMKAAVF